MALKWLLLNPVGLGQPAESPWSKGLLSYPGQSSCGHNPQICAHYLASAEPKRPFRPGRGHRIQLHSLPLSLPLTRPGPPSGLPYPIPPPPPPSSKPSRHSAVKPVAHHHLQQFLQALKPSPIDIPVPPGVGWGECFTLHNTRHWWYKCTTNAEGA